MNLDDINLFLDKFKLITHGTSDDIDLLKVLSIPFNQFYEILNLYNRLDEKEQIKYKGKVLHSLDYKTALLIMNSEFKQALLLLNPLDSAIYMLYNEIKYHDFFIRLSVKHVQCLLKDENLNDADFRCKNAVHYFKKNFKYWLSESNKNNERLGKLCFELIQLRSIIKKIMVEFNNHNLKSRYRQYLVFSKEFEQMILKTGTIDNKISDHTYIQPSIMMPNFIHNPLINWVAIRKLKGLSKIILQSKINFIRFLIYVSNFFWGFGFNTLKVIRSSIIIVILYTLLMFCGIIKVIHSSSGIIEKNLFNNLYFSIVTFTSLGYGDLIPYPSIFSRLLMASEAIMGLICFSLIIFTIGKRYN